MQIKLVEVAPAGRQVACLVWGVVADEKLAASGAAKGRRGAAGEVSPATLPLPDLSPWLSAAALAARAAQQNFTGALGAQLVVDLPPPQLLPEPRAARAKGGRTQAGPGGWQRLALIGLGPASRLDMAVWTHLGGQASRLAAAAGASHLMLTLPPQPALSAVRSDAPNAAAEAAADPHDSAVLERLLVGVHLGGYCDPRFRRPPKVRPVALADLQVRAGGGGAWAAAHRACPARAAAIAAAVAHARHLINEPAMTLTPQAFAKRAQAMARRSGLACKVMGVAELRRRKMELLLGVGMGSQNPPALVHLTYTPKRAARGQAPVVLVGKGITFDSGGLCLKSPDGMMGMKVDMGGAAAVMATLEACAALKLDRPVVGIMALAENMPSGSALRLGDVLTHASGKTVEINNTDAEGRLVLADALHYAGALKPACIIDLATLTGACMVALGAKTAGLYANREPLAAELMAAAAHSGESFWRMPLLPGLKTQLKSDLADMRNTGERYGGSITAALFLQEFVGEVAWAHMDIAGPVTSHESVGATSKGGTGFGVATLLAFLLGQAGRAGDGRAAGRRDG